MFKKKELENKCDRLEDRDFDNRLRLSIILGIADDVTVYGIQTKVARDWQQIFYELGRQLKK